MQETSESYLFGDPPTGTTLERLVVSAPALVSAQAYLALGNVEEACNVLSGILGRSAEMSLVVLQAWRLMREMGRSPSNDQRDVVLGVVVEVGIEGGVDSLGVYPDLSVHYYNHADSSLIWEKREEALEDTIQKVLGSAKTIVPRVGIWNDQRLPAPSEGRMRLSILTPQGVHFGEGTIEALEQDHVARSLVHAATKLMVDLVLLSKKEPPSIGEAESGNA
jgi:hypothetical protein